MHCPCASPGSFFVGKHRPLPLLCTFKKIFEAFRSVWIDALWKDFSDSERSGAWNDDLLLLPGLLAFFPYLAPFSTEALPVTQAVFKGETAGQPVLSVQAELLHPVPKPFSLHLPQGYLSCQETGFGFLLYGICDTLKYYYPDYQNYYYLPEEDQAIHKSVDRLRRSCLSEKGYQKYLLYKENRHFPSTAFPLVSSGLLSGPGRIKPAIFS